MNRFLSILVTLTWGIWIGALVGVMLSVISLAHTFTPGSDERFALAAPPIFSLFERIQLGLAAAAMILTFAWRLRSGAKGLKNFLFTLFALSTIAAVVESTYVRPQMQRLKKVDQTQSADFQTFHKLSERLYGGTLLMLIVAGVMLPTTISNDGRK